MGVDLILRINGKDVFINQAFPRMSCVCEVTEGVSITKEEQLELLKWVDDNLHPKSKNKNIIQRIFKK